jgi:polysaccharide deacetylase 2 family uncharacterized protein YibQ
VKFLRRKGRKKRPALLPAILLLVFLALVGGTVTWLQLSSGGHHAQDQAAQTKPHAPEHSGTEHAAAPKGEHAAEHKAEAPQAAKADGHAEAPKPAAPHAEKPHAETEHAAAATPAEQSAPKPGEPAPAATQGGEMVAPPAAPPQLRIKPVRTGPPLPAAPDGGLVEQSPFGPIPRAGLDGREAWRIYARPFYAKDKRPRISVVVHGLGISDTVTQAAIRGLPSGITLGFSPYADRVGDWLRLARQAGHETLLLIPMEPVNYPVSDPGPRALMTSLTPEENLKRLHWLLARGTGYVGVATYMGSRFAASRRHARATLEELKKRGLMLLDAAQGNKSLLSEIAGGAAVPIATSALFVDRKLTAAEIDARLAELETRAREQGRIVAMARPYPVTLERLAAWAAEVEKRGFVLAPVSALAERTRPS